MIKLTKKYTKVAELIITTTILILFSIILAFGVHDSNRKKLNIKYELSMDAHLSTIRFKDIVPKGFVYTKEKSLSESKRLKKAKKKIDFTVGFPYMIMVNRSENFAVIYGLNKKKGTYSVPYKAFYCSTAKNKKNTPLGTFYMSEKFRWHLMVDGTYAQYAIRIAGEIMLHSVPYYEPKNNKLESGEYNKLGEPASLGCVRFSVKDIKWIYDNCGYKTAVTIYDKKNEEPPKFIKEQIKIDESSENSGWDPTDPNKHNPWNK